MTKIDLHPDDFEPDDFPIIVAIDFGTTFSGCAYAYAPDDEEARTITAWPKQNIQYAKTPTLNLYTEVNGKYKMMEWGWKSKLEMDSPSASKHIQISQYKPYLDENLVLAPWKNIVSVPDAISDYLYALHEYAVEKILQEFGPSYSRKCFRYCLTVPAMWSDKAKDVMRRAAIRAKLITEADHPERLTLVSEPEAAALYCKRACKQYDLEDGDRFLICDAGGGTVDLIVYDIQLSSQGQRLSEVTKGHGASCGSMFIDMNFRNLLIQKFGRSWSKFPKGIVPRLIETFAYQLKPHFDGVEDQYLALPRSDCFDHLEDPGAIGIDGGYMRLKAFELKETVFEPVVVKVLKLIQEQLDAAKECSAIFMVGGFGASNYLLHRVKQEFSGMVKTIAVPYKPEIAVVCGAVYVGLNPKTFQDGVDPIALKVHKVDGVYCNNRFSVFVKKDQKVKVDECVTRFYSVTKQDKHDTGECSLRIYAINGQPPRYTTGLIELAEILLPGPFKSGHPVRHTVSIKAKMYFGLNEIKAVATIQDKEYSTTLRFEDGDSYTRPQLQYL
ncbi:Heat shock 70 kDa protein 12A [Mortierella sp. NVP41]|nr:Heat shock 70 kDa protein 12A [Mortierella sp. NVP41]